jgi:Na+/H+ antiporter
MEILSGSGPRAAISSQSLRFADGLIDNDVGLGHALNRDSPPRRASLYLFPVQDTLLFILLLSFVFGLGLLARRLGVPYPILFVIGGLCISFLPGLPTQLSLSPNLFFFLFLPPILYWQAFNTSWRDFRRELRPILLLAIGLVLATTITVAFVSHWLIPGFPLAAGFVLGAIISPPDAIAAAAIAQRLGLPRRIVTILEGESLVNDATSLVAFKTALAAVGASVPLIGGAWMPGEFIYIALGGIVAGLMIGWGISWIRRRIADDGPQNFLTIALITPFLSYIVADQMLQVSGVLSVVATGLYLGWESPEVVTSSVRLQAVAVWDIIVYLLNGIVFVLIGLQLPGILHRLDNYTWPQLLLYVAVVNAVCIVVRMLWVFPGAYVPYLASRRVKDHEVLPTWREVSIVGWSGMRGIVSLAAALGLEAYPGFPRAHLVQFLAFSVILITLVFQGLTLPPLIRWLGVDDDGSAAAEERVARLRISVAVFDKIKEVRAEDKFAESALETVERSYRERALVLEDELLQQLGWTDRRHHVQSMHRLWRLTIATQRRALIDLRRKGVIADDVMHKIEHELDLEEARLRGDVA